MNEENYILNEIDEDMMNGNMSKQETLEYLNEILEGVKKRIIEETNRIEEDDE